MPIRTRRWNDPEQAGDGLRVLVCRYRPRALPKADETWEVWLKDLGPSRELHADVYGKHGPPIDWPAYVVSGICRWYQPPSVVPVPRFLEVHSGNRPPSRSTITWKTS